jgi:hypothetical protein
MIAATSVPIQESSMFAAESATPWRVDAVALADEGAIGQVDHRALDAAPADVDAD